MDPTDVIAAVALTSIPVGVLMARWQMRTALAQSEASHRAALAVAQANHQTALAAAEANHRTALEAAEANHRSALETARNQVIAERARWIAEARRAEYKLFQSSLAQFRRALIADELEFKDLKEALNELHEAHHALRMVGPAAVSGVAQTILYGHCLHITNHVDRSPGLAQQERAEMWRTRLSPLRTELDEAISLVNAVRWE
ncbi:hypothetical protein [Streptomyces sp. NPDC058812]|uniref:hypothetical protein n=1 Tax=unclassified Streptomyces TaxID=2593676 RepID=UPI0036B46098